jgi:DNA-binding transcriptional MocR family regulator
VSFAEALRKARSLLRDERRLSSRALARELGLGTDDLAAVIEELVDVQHVATREGQVLIWSGGDRDEPVPASATAGPMEHGIYRVVDFEQLGTYTLRVSFDDGTSQVIDFDPETLHDWPKVRDAFTRMTAQWRD